MTVYDFAKKCMADEEYNRGGLPKNERKYLDAIGFKYTVEDGCIAEAGDDLKAFYDAMAVLCNLNIKYQQKTK